MPIPSMSNQQSASSGASTGAFTSSAGWDSSGFNVNYGNASGQGTIGSDVTKQLMVAAIIGLAALWAKKHFK